MQKFIDIEAFGFYYNPDFMSIEYPMYTNVTNATLTDGGNIELNAFEIMTKIFTISVIILNVLTFFKISYYYVSFFFISYRNFLYLKQVSFRQLNPKPKHKSLVSVSRKTRNSFYRFAQFLEPCDFSKSLSKFDSTHIFRNL